jgi:hypothetical protein
VWPEVRWKEDSSLIALFISIYNGRVGRDAWKEGVKGMKKPQAIMICTEYQC